MINSREFLVQTVSGFVQEDGIIHYEDAIEIAKFMAVEYETDVEILMTNPLIFPKFNLVETVPQAELAH